MENFAYGDTPSWVGVAGLILDLFSRTELEFSLNDLSCQFDIRLNVLKTLLTYLELGGHLLERGPRFDTYRFRPVEGAGRHSALQSGLMGQILLLREAGHDVVHALSGCGRRPAPAVGEELVNALVEAQEAGMIELGAGRPPLPLPPHREPAQLEQLVHLLMERLMQREAREIARLHEILRLATHDGCQTNWLAAYFGEERAAPCGHCSWCRTHMRLVLPA